jgi:hypothetical protein
MRPWTLILPLCAAALCAAAHPAPADSPGPAEMVGAPLECFLLVTDGSNLSEHQALTLCTAAPSTGPAECFFRADSELPRSRQQNIDLCRCARTSWPVDCFQEARRQTFLSGDQIAVLCSPITALALSPGCLTRCP